MKAVRELKSGGAGTAPAARESTSRTVPPAPAVRESPARPAANPKYASHALPDVSELMSAPAPDFSNRTELLDDPKLNAVLSAVPGAMVTDIKEGGR